MSEKKNINEGYQPSQRNNGYKPQGANEQRGYQPKPNSGFGYQPNNKSITPPKLPTSGSNAIKPQKNNDK